MVLEQSDINISLLLFCQPFYSVPLRLNTHCSQRDLISVNTIRYRSVKMCLQELYFKKVVAHHDHALVQVPRSVWMYKGCPVSAHAPLVLISCTAEANFPQASECKAAFTLQTKVGKLVLANSSWCVWTAWNWTVGKHVSFWHQQFANVFTACFCAVHTHQLEFANTSLPT